MLPVIATQDESSHWYVIPADQHKEFCLISNDIYESNFKDYDLIQEFESKYGKYRTGGDLNNVQLYTEI